MIDVKQDHDDNDVIDPEFFVPPGNAREVIGDGGGEGPAWSIVVLYLGLAAIVGMTLFACNYGSELIALARAILAGR